jgi:hypothetical protein
LYEKDSGIQIKVFVPIDIEKISAGRYWYYRFYWQDKRQGRYL